jgi:hypothetical protein
VVPLVYEIERLHREGKLTEEIEDAADMRYVQNYLLVQPTPPVPVATPDYIMGLSAMLTTCRPIGVVGGSVNKADQTAAEIVDEMVQETVSALKGANSMLSPASKL